MLLLSSLVDLLWLACTQNQSCTDEGDYFHYFLLSNVSGDKKWL
jgi:hypothetical protein